MTDTTLRLICPEKWRWSLVPPRAWVAPRRSTWPRPGATVVVNDMAGALESSDVLDEIAAAGPQGCRRCRGHQRALDRRRAGRHRRWSGWPGHRRQQRGHHPRPDPVQHERRGVGRGHRGAPARPLPVDPQCRGLLAQQGQGGGRHGLRPDHQHLVGGRAVGARRSAQLRRRQGGHHRAHGVGRPRPGALRCTGQRDRTAGPHRNDRGRLRGCARRLAEGGSTRCRPTMSSPLCDSWPRPRPKLSTVSCSSSSMVQLSRWSRRPQRRKHFTANSDAWNPADLQRDVAAG